MRPDARVAALLLALGLVSPAPVRAEEPLYDAALELLLAPDLRSDEERAGEATDLLHAERSRKLAEMSSSFVDLGLNATVSANPLRVLRAAGEIGKEVRDWNLRTDAEDAALTLLEPGAQNGALDASQSQLYERLVERAEETHVARLLDSGRAALERGDLRSARRNVDRALELEPGSTAADELLDAIDLRAWRDEPDGETVARAIEGWELRLLSALLLDDYARARELGPSDSPEAEFARASALQLSGERSAAYGAFEELADGDGPTAAHARLAMHDPELFPEQALGREASRYRRERALGFLGGEKLVQSALPDVESALEMSRGGYKTWQGTYRAWRDSARPINLVLDAPARILDAWQPEGLALRGAAERMLELEPDGALAVEASEWLEELAPQELARVAPFRDGVLVLPPSRTRYVRVSDTRVVVAREALERELGELPGDLGLGDAPALLLSLHADEENPGRLVPSERALELLARLAGGLEAAELAPRGKEPREVSETLRRLHAGVRSGATLRAHPWYAREHTELRTALVQTLDDGSHTRTVGGVEVARDEEELFAERDLTSAGPICPPETACIDRARAVASGLYAQTSAEGDLGVGARAVFLDAKLAVEIGSSGPRVSLVLPMARWLGLARFFPVQAQFSVGGDGLSAGPRLDKGVEDLPSESY